MANEGINFTRMYTEPSCTPTRAAFLTGRHLYATAWALLACPMSFQACAQRKVTIAEVLSEAGYATAFFGKGHLGDIEESYLYNQGFDEALFTPMNRLRLFTILKAMRLTRVLGLHPEIYPPDPYRLDHPGLVPEAGS